jgi:RHS repeat-associated protein
VYFDDFKVEHRKSPVVSSQDYYAFGLTFGSYQRENSLGNQYQFNGKEQQDELNLGWLDYGARMYQADIGRWGVIDPKSEKYLGITPYAYVANIPTKLTDPTGMEIEWDVSDKKDKRQLKREVRELRRSSETFNKEWKQLKKSDATYTVHSNKSVDKFLTNDSNQPKAGLFIPNEGKEGGSLLINSEVIKNNEGAVLEQTLAEEVTHGVQKDDGVSASKLDMEFEAKAVTGVILQEAGLLEKAQRDRVDDGPFKYGSGLSQGTQSISDYRTNFTFFYSTVDLTGGYGGNTSKTPGAVTNSDPTVLKKLIKQ